MDQGRKAMSAETKIDVMDLLILFVKEHEEKLDEIEARLEEDLEGLREVYGALAKLPISKELAPGRIVVRGNSRATLNMFPEGAVLKPELHRNRAGKVVGVTLIREI